MPATDIVTSISISVNPRDPADLPSPGADLIELSLPLGAVWLYKISLAKRLQWLRAAPLICGNYVRCRNATGATM
jgi:hypothetical protein